MTIGERIRSARLAKGVTQEELAKALHTTKQTIYKYEMGIVTNIPSDKIELMASYLDISEAYIMGWEERGLTPNRETAEFLIMMRHSPKLVQLVKDFMELNEDQQGTVLALIHSMIPSKNP